MNSFFFFTCQPPVAPVVPVGAQGLSADHTVREPFFQDRVPGLAALLPGRSFRPCRLGSLGLQV